MRGAYLYHAGIFARTFAYTLRAPFFEIAIGGHIDGIGNVARNIEQLIFGRIHRRLRLLQSLRIRMTGIMENFRDGALLYNSARIHDDDVIRHFGNYPEIVRNQQNGTVDPALQIVEQIENLRLNRHVERGRRARLQ